jgi:Zn-dependent protease
MNPTFRIARVFGISIGVNWSWAVLFALIVWSLAASVFPAQNPGLSHAEYAVMAVVAALLFFVSLLLHELGHAYQARREGVEIEGITLWLFGGVARFKGMFESAGAEFRIAIAGPIVSLVLGTLFVALAVAAHGAGAVDGVAAWLGYINLALLLFNLLPALPLDGGRVFRSALWALKGDFGWATRIAADVGRGFGFLLIGGGLVLLALGSISGVWLAFVGWFLLQAAALEGRYGMLRDALGDLRVRDLMVRDPVTVRAGASLGEFMDEIAQAHRYTTYPVTDNGRVVGLLPFSSVARVPRREWEHNLVAECMLPRAEVPVVREDEELMDAVEDLGHGGIDRALVLEGERLVGLLSVTDVGRLLTVKTRRRP